MRSWIAAFSLALGLSACAAPPPPARPIEPAPPEPPVAAVPPPAADQCGLAEAQAYVGRQRSEIPVPLEPSTQRVACTTCPMTMDFNPRRLNFLFDAQTGVVREVKCG